MSLRDVIKGALYGGIVGDALGVPVEFTSRKERDENPVIDMIGYGTYNQPPGTWSDDSTMALITMESFIDNNEVDFNKILDGWCRWLDEGYWTPYGNVFDIGNSTREALKNYKINKDWKKSGNKTESGNGNGSLMRMMPFSIWNILENRNMEDDIVIKMSSDFSSTTHAHIISKICCSYHTILSRYIKRGFSLHEAMEKTTIDIEPFLMFVDEKEKEKLNRILSGEVITLDQSKISGSGYVIHCLEASLWCLANTSDFSSAVLAAVNLGNDTDTTACVTGGLAGWMYGIQDIPKKWIDSLARLNDIITLVDKFTSFVIGE